MKGLIRKLLLLSVALVLGFNPVLAALECSMRCNIADQSLLATPPDNGSVERDGQMSEHCQRLMQHAQMPPASVDIKLLPSDIEPENTHAGYAGSGVSECDCPSSCGVSTAALISLLNSWANPLSPQLVDDLELLTVPAVLVLNPYRPPIA